MANNFKKTNLIPRSSSRTETTTKTTKNLRRLRTNYTKEKVNYSKSMRISIWRILFYIILFFVVL
jgi:hypothetical protein